MVKFRDKTSEFFPESSKFRRLLDENVDKLKNFLLIWIAFTVSFHLIIVRIYVSCVIFPILMFNHFLKTNPYKLSSFERSATYTDFFRKLHSPIGRNSEEKV